MRREVIIELLFEAAVPCALLLIPAVCYAAVQTEVVFPAKNSYHVGKPMPVEVHIRNTGSTPAQYQTYAEAYGQYNNPLRVIGPDHKPVPFTGLLNLNQQEAGAAQPELAPKSVKKLFEMDLSQAYSIVQPGFYTVEYHGDFASASPPVTLHVFRGQPRFEDLITSRLIERYGKKWSIVRSKEFFDPPKALKSDLSFVVTVMQMHEPGFTVVCLKQGHAPVPSSDGWTSLGQCAAGDAYVVIADQQRPKFPRLELDLKKILVISK
jgi:hypothetical protein